jgi:endonuclease/exonuclease/phosphatase family metal-dependent hydrolase
MVGRLASPWTAVDIETLAGPATSDRSLYPLRIASYNIAHGRGGSLGASSWDGGPGPARRKRLEAIGSFLDDRGIDVVVLNEVDFSALWSDHQDQAAIIARAGGYPFVARQRNIDVAVPFIRFKFGNAVLSRFPILSAQRMRFGPYSRLEALLAGNHDSLLTRIRLPDGLTIAVWALHLERRNERTRIEAVECILETATSITDPLFIVGDFNSSPRSFPWAQPVAEGHTALDLIAASNRFAAFPALHGSPDEFTFPSVRPDRTIDWAFVPADWWIGETLVAEASWSDHLPIIVSVYSPTD